MLTTRVWVRLAAVCFCLLSATAGCGADDDGGPVDAGPLSTFCGEWPIGDPTDIPCGAAPCMAGQQCCVNAVFVDGGVSCWVLGCIDVGASTVACGHLTQCNGQAGQCGTGEFCCASSDVATHTRSSQTCQPEGADCAAILCDEAARCPASLPYCNPGLETPPTCQATPP